MDIVSHGLWGGIAFGRQTKKTFWSAFAFGVLPDLLAFGPHFANSLMSSAMNGNFSWRAGRFDIPDYVHAVYHVTHSLVIFAIAFIIVWAILRRPFLPMLAWGLHILMDIPTHSQRFFPTPFLWPLSDFTIDGVPWGQPMIFYPDVALLLMLYVWYFAFYRRRHRSRPSS